MSLLRTLDRTSAVSPTLFKSLYRSKNNNEKSRAFVTGAVTGRFTSQESMDSFFITALARAASCPDHARHISRHQRREYKSTPAQKEKDKEKGRLKRVQQFAENELKALVDYYGIQIDKEEGEQPVEDSDKSPLVWMAGVEHEPRPFNSPKDEAAAVEIDLLLEDEETPHEHVFAVYKLLPSPGVAYLSSKTIRKLLHHLSVVDRPTPPVMQRFLSLLDDMNNANIHITQAEWTTAIYLAGRSMGAVGQDEVHAALYLWRDMEKRARIRGGRVTMNVLFDIAVKAGKYALAETFLQEMRARNIPFHRHFRVSLIYYHGVQLNGNGVRRAYQDLIEAGDVVDTVVMNAVIAALIRAGEPAAAEQVFERMKRLAASRSNILHSPLPYNTRFWRGRRQLGLHFTKTAAALVQSGDSEALKQLQEAAPIAPNSHTYSLLIRHYATTVGDINHIIKLLREMGYNGVPVEGSIFIVIFHGFRKHGAVNYSGWTRSRLEQTWQEYLDAVRNGLDRTWISSMSVCSALQAFGKCADGERVMKAWEEVKVLWEPSEMETEHVMNTIRRVVPRQSPGVGGFFAGSEF